MEYLKDKVIVVIVVESLDSLKSKVTDLISEGYSVLEITLRTECAFDAIQYVKDNYPEIKVGAGTVLTVTQLNKCIEIGADFAVAPGLNPEIVNVAKAQGFSFIPGVATASDIEHAMRLGVSLVKVFPANCLGGVNFIKAISGPYHTMKFMPTGGITKDDFPDYLKLSNVFCVGGSWMSK